MIISEAIDRLMLHSVMLELNIQSYRTQGDKNSGQNTSN